MKTTKAVRSSSALYIIFLSIIFLWLALLTKYAIDSRDIQQIQAKNDSEAIYKLMLENAKQQEKIDELSK